MCLCATPARTPTRFFWLERDDAINERQWKRSNKHTQWKVVGGVETNTNAMFLSNCECDGGARDRKRAALPCEGENCCPKVLMFRNISLIFYKEALVTSPRSSVLKVEENGERYSSTHTFIDRSCIILIIIEK